MNTKIERRGRCVAYVPTSRGRCSCREYANVAGRRFEGWPICTNCKHVEGVHKIERVAA